MMVEGAIAFPIIILSAILMIRMFVFSLEVLDTGVVEHRKALEEWDHYSGSVMRVYEKNAEVSMFRGGMLRFNVKKSIDARLYLINEDFIVRSSELID